MGKHQTAAMAQVQISASKMSLKLCLTLAVVALLAIPLVGANTVAGFVQGQVSTGGGTYVCPAGSVDVGSEAECSSAATELGHPFSGVLESSVGHWWFKGCTLVCELGEDSCDEGCKEMFFNPHETGCLNGCQPASMVPICALTSMLSNETTSMPSNEPTSAGSDGCPDGTRIYHQGSHCCNRAVDHNGNTITYSSENCQADDFIDCPAGAVDGACGPPPSNEPTSMPSNEPTGVVRFVQGQSSAGGGTYVCPAGSVDVGSEAECRSAATELGRPFEVTDSPLERKGCTLIVPCCAHMNDVHFNTYDQGSATEDAAPICALSSMLSNEPTSMPSNEPTSMLSNEPTSMPSNEPTTSEPTTSEPTTSEPTAYAQGPISTTCFDLKSSYQKNSCCSQDTGNTATFNGTAVTCGNVLASYKSSECCSADLAKNATMIFE